MLVMIFASMTFNFDFVPKYCSTPMFCFYLWRKELIGYKCTIPPPINNNYFPLMFCEGYVENRGVIWSVMWLLSV